MWAFFCPSFCQDGIGYRVKLVKYTLGNLHYLKLYINQQINMEVLNSKHMC